MSFESTLIDRLSPMPSRESIVAMSDDEQREFWKNRAFEHLVVAGEELARLREEAEVVERHAVRFVRSARAQGIQWSAIGRVFGLTTQGAQQKFGRRMTYGG